MHLGFKWGLTFLYFDINTKNITITVIEKGLKITGKPNPVKNPIINKNQAIIGS